MKISLSDKYNVKEPCTRCGETTYKICYVGKKLVCVDCFNYYCMKRVNKKALEPGGTKA